MRPGHYRAAIACPPQVCLSGLVPIRDRIRILLIWRPFRRALSPFGREGTAVILHTTSALALLPRSAARGGAGRA
jgi:hypothetical protein